MIWYVSLMMLRTILETATAFTSTVAIKLVKEALVANPQTLE